MSYLRVLARRIRTASVALTAWLVVYSVVLAQAANQPAKKDAGTTGTGPYVMAYMLVILAIVLGLLIVCRSSNRRDRARPEGFVETSMVEQKKPSPQAKK